MYMYFLYIDIFMYLYFYVFIYLYHNPEPGLETFLIKKICIQVGPLFHMKMESF